MSINNHWRNKQLNHNLLWQESQCLDFCQQQQDVVWAWHGAQDYFFDRCQSELQFDGSATGAIIINIPTQVSVDQFVTQIRHILTPSVRTAYLAVNRYEFVVADTHDLFPDTIEQCIDHIVAQCDTRFRRLYEPTQVDGAHFVGVHGLDVYVYD